MTTQEHPTTSIDTLEAYQAHVSSRLGIEDDPEALHAAMRFRVWNGDFDREVAPGAASQILGRLGLDANIVYRTLE